MVQDVKMLYKTIVETELMVLARNESEAGKIGLENASGEILSGYGKAKVLLIENASQIPEEWKSNIPYSMSPETKSCYQIFSVKNNEKKDLQNEDIDDIIKARKKNIESDVNIDEKKDETKPETRPDPKPKELEWKDTKTGRQLPHLRFKL